MIRFSRGVVIVGMLTTALALHPPAAGGQERPRRERVVKRGRDLTQERQQIRRAQSLTRRVLRDRRATPEMKQQATELQTLLVQRDAALASLDARQREFVASHQPELDELDELRMRARQLEERLKASRSEVLKASAGEIAALKRNSSRAAELTEAIRQGYERQRKERRRR